MDEEAIENIVKFIETLRELEEAQKDMTEEEKCNNAEKLGIFTINC